MKKQEIIEMFHKADCVSKTHIQSLDLLEKYCVERGYELIKEGRGDYRLREFEAVEDWTKPIKFVYEDFGEDKFNECNGVPIELIAVLANETNGFFDPRVYTYLLNHKDGGIVDFGPAIAKYGHNNWIIDLDILAAYGVIEEDYDSIWIHNYFQRFEFTNCQERPKIGRQGKFKCYINGTVEELTTDKQNWYWTGL